MPGLLDTLGLFYAELEQRIAAHQPACRNRGACCKFDAYGHRLFVTGLEMIWFLHHHRDEVAGSGAGEPVGLLVQDVESSFGSRALPQLARRPGASCPFQQQGLCTTRAGRPVGCRVFFCESEKEGWQSELTEWALGRLKQLHEQFQMPYTYAEWLTALEQLRCRPVADVPVSDTAGFP